MKKLLLLLLSLPAFAQSGFMAEGKDVLWQKSFSTQDANIVAMLDKNPSLKVGGFMDNMYKGMAVEMQNTCQGGTGLMQNPVKFEFVVLVDPAGYVVKVRNLKIIEKYGPMQARTMANPSEKYFMDGTALKTDSTSIQNMECLDSFLTSVFQPQTLPSEPTSLTSNK